MRAWLLILGLGLLQGFLVWRLEYWSLLLLAAAFGWAGYVAGRDSKR